MADINYRHIYNCIHIMEGLEVWGGERWLEQLSPPYAIQMRDLARQGREFYEQGYRIERKAKGENNKDYTKSLWENLAECNVDADGSFYTYCLVNVGILV